MLTNEPAIERGKELTMTDIATIRCPDCESVGTFTIRPTEMVVSVGDNTALVTVNALVCGICGHEEVDGTNATKLDEVRERLERGDVAGMKPVGTTYRVQS